MKHVTYLVLLLLSVVISSCQNGTKNNEEASIYGSLTRNNALGEVTFPLSPLHVDGNLKQRIDAAQDVDDIFHIQRFIKLENGPSSIVSMIDSAVKINHFWFIVDRTQRQVFQFNDSGAFIRRVGRKGQGPGEYEYPYTAQVLNDQLVIADVDRSALVFFDTSGKFIRELSTTHTGIAVQSQFFLTPGRFYTAGFRTADHQSPYAAIFDISGESPTIITGFGKRSERIFRYESKPGSGRHRFDAFARVGNHVWAGSPYHSTIDVFDLEGRACGQLKPGFDGLQISDYEESHFSNERKFSEFIFSKGRNLGIYPIGNGLVITDYGTAQMSLRDTHGNLVRTGLKTSSILRTYLGLFNNEAVFSFETNIEHMSYYDNEFSNQQREALISSGWNPQDFADDNPYLVIATLNPTN